jgi:hypothetical protein
MLRGVCIRAGLGLFSTLTIGVCLNGPTVAQTLSFSTGPQSAAPVGETRCVITVDGREMSERIGSVFLAGIRVRTGQDVPPVQGATVSLIQVTDSVVDRFVNGAIINGSAAYQAPADTRWTAVRSLAHGSKVEVELYDAPLTRGYAVDVTGDSMTIATKSGQRRVERHEIRRIRVARPTRRLLYGAIGIGAGLLGGFMVCPQCANEGAPGLQARNMAIGASAGSLAFLISGYHTVYEGPPQRSLSK